MKFKRSLNVVGVHACGEVGDVVVGGVLEPPGKFDTMYDKLQYFQTHHDDIRNLLLQEPRGRSSMCANLVLAPCDPRADAGFLIMEADEWAHMSGSNTICTATALLETGMVPMTEPVTKLNLDTAAGLVSVTCECRNGKCVSVEFDNVPSFVFKLDYPVDVPGLGEVKVDIVWSGMMFAVVEAKQLGLEVSSENGGKIVELGERVKRAVQGCGYVPVHPENEGIRGVTNLVVTEEVKEVEVESGGKRKWARNATVVSPGRLDRSPCGTGTSARLAIMHARGQTAVDEPFTHASPIGTEFECRIRGVTKVGEYDAVLPTVKGKGWITSFKQVVLDDSDPFPTGFRVGDAWHVGDT